MRGPLSGKVNAPQAKLLLAAMNGATTQGPPADYAIGFAGSENYTSWDTQGTAKISAGTGWESVFVAQPWLVWDGSQFVIYYSGWDGSNVAIGRATASDFFTGSWTKYGSNPVLGHGAASDPDEVGCGMPVIWHDAGDTPAWRMWYHAFPAGASPSNPAGLSVCFADSSDGLSWTKRGVVIPVGAGGAFNDVGTDNGCVIKSGSTWYVFAAGYHTTAGNTAAKSAYCTTTDPANAASYSSLTQLTNYTGTITVGGKTWRSNQPRGIMANPDGSGNYLCWLTLWNPTVGGGIIETCVQVTSTDLTSWGTPSALMLAYDSWDTISSENPSVILQP